MIFNDDETRMFLIKLRAVAKASPHTALASQLDIPVWQLRNWLYRDQPSPYVVRALMPEVSKIYDKTKTKQRSWRTKTPTAG